MAVFSVIISEKGGAERRETYDRNEINVGRVQGNDLMLPKGNVSKRHARLLCRDGRFIVTDLKSTNGTYVNGRKIAQATIVREGDKIYIGDFVLRIEAGAPSQADRPTSEDSGLLVNPVSSMPPDAPRPTSPPAGSPQPASAVAVPPAPSPFGAATPFVSGLPRPDVAEAQPSAEPPSSEPSSPDRGPRPPSPRIAGPVAGDRHEVISHFPLEQDPDESVHFAVPGPPRVPSPPKPIGRGAPVPVHEAALQAKPSSAPAHDGAPQPSPRPSAAPMPPPSPAADAPRPVPIPAPQPPVVTPTAPPARPVIPQPGSLLPPNPPVLDRPTAPSMGLAALVSGLAPGSDAPRTGPEAASGKAGVPAPLAAIPPPRRPMPSSPMERAAAASPAAVPSAAAPAADPARAAAHRRALAALVERVGEVVDLRPLAEGSPAEEAFAARVERALSDAAAALKGEADAEALAVEARRELLEVGPLTTLLEDEDVTEIQVVRHDHVVALHGRRQVPTEAGFTSEQAVGRAIRRLCHAAGRPLAPGEVYVERRLPRGARLFAVLPRPEDGGHMFVIRKPQRADLSLEDLVRAGTISRAMAGLFAQCVAARANILVTGAEGAGATTLLGALAGAGSTDDRVVVLQEDDELVFNQPHTISILLGDDVAERARAVQAAARMRPDRLVVGAFAGGVAAEVVDVMADGVDGVLAGARAATLRQAVLRLAADLAGSKPGVSPDVAREWLASVFDLAIEVARLRDGRHRVLRVAELAVEGSRIVLRDIFAFNVERTAAGGAIEGTFAPTGVIPGVIEDLAARGVAVDPSTFRRHAKESIIR